MKHAIIIVLLAAILGSQVARYFIKPPPPPPPDWRAEVKAKLPALGHRNWIVVADSAYPASSREGVTIIVTNQSQIDTLKSVLAMISESTQVKANVYEDKELEYVSEDDAKGLLSYRMDLKSVLKDAPVTTEDHETLLAKVDDAAKTYSVIVLKTNMTLPYTTVFINLDCAYWDDDKQARLVKAMKKKP